FEFVGDALRQQPSRADRLIAFLAQAQGATFRGVQPLRTAIFPVKAAGKRADGIEIAFQIGEIIFARRIVQTLFAGRTGGANGKNARLRWLAIHDVILAANFKQPDVALPVIQIPLNGAGQGHEAGGFQHSRFFGKRIRELRRLRVRRTEQVVALFRHVRDGKRFLIPEPDQALAQAGLRFVMRQTRRSDSGYRQTRREVVQTIEPCDFLDQIDFALDVRAPGRSRALPSGQQRIRGAAIIVHAHGSKTKRAENGFEIFVGNVRAHHAQEFRARQGDLFWRALSWIHVHDSGEQFATGKLQDQFRTVPRSRFRHFRVRAPTKARAGFGVKFQEASGAANRDGIKPGAFDQHVFRGKGDFRFRSAHHATADGSRAITIANQRHVWLQLTFDAIQRDHFFAGPGAPDNNSVVAHFVVVERVNGIAEFQHHVIGDVDDVADAGGACGSEAVFQPGRRRLNLDVANHPCGVTAAELRRIDLNGNRVARFVSRLGELWRKRLQRQAVDRGNFPRNAEYAKAIRPVGSDLSVNYSAVRTVFDARDVGAGKRQARSNLFRWSAHVHKLFQPVVSNFHALIPVELPEIHSSEVVHADAAIALVRGEKALQLRHHRREIRMTFLGCVGTAPQAPAQPFPSEDLVIGQVARGKAAIVEKVADGLHFRISIANAFVIGTKALQQDFVLA